MMMRAQPIFLHLSVFLTAVTIAASAMCDGRRTELAASLGRCLSHPLAKLCPDGTQCQCVAAVFSLCSVGHPTGSWRPGTRVRGNCNSIPKYAPIATFNGPNRTYGGDGVKKHTGIFSRCIRNDRVEMFDQWCGKRFGLYTWRFDTAYQDFYVIN